MQIEAGRYYRARDGRKAFVAAKSHFEKAKQTHKFVGFLNCGLSGAWAPDGRTFHCAEVDSDLVSEWREPVTRTGVVALLRCQKSGTVFISSYSGDKTVPDCIRFGGYDVLAEQQITLTEKL